MSVAEKKTAKKSKMIEAAFELFTKNGINLTAVDEVAKRAGVAKGTFYLYFKDKYDLLNQTVILKCENLVRDVVASMSETLDSTEVAPYEKVTLFIDRIIDAFTADRNLAVLAMRDMSIFRKLWAFDGKEEKTELYNKFLSIFIDGGCEAQDAPKRMYMTFIAVAGICSDSILYESPYTVQELKPQIHHMIKNLVK